jgi:hypothetical protein
MSRFTGSARTAVDYDSTIIGALELSERKRVLAVQLPGVSLRAATISPFGYRLSARSTRSTRRSPS